jgi:transposase
MPRRITSASVSKLPTELPETVPARHELIHQLMQRLSLLEERVNLNSRNSSKPPSSDGPATPARPSKPPSGKKLGGQPGHKGSSQTIVPEQEVHHRTECLPPPQCEACGSAVEVDGDKPMRHQVFELPRIEPVAREYVRLRGICSGCGCKHHGALPAGAPCVVLVSRQAPNVG